MTGQKRAKKIAKRSASPGTDNGSPSKGFTAEERAVMRERASEIKASRRGSPDDESAVLAKIAELPQPDRAMAERIHRLIMASAPSLAPRLWYGMPAYAKDGNVLCFFQSANKFKTRYTTLGFSDKAALDEGQMWPTSFALKELTPDVEMRISALVKRAANQEAP